jgi:tRNA(adenine34) deaminase
MHDDVDSKMMRQALLQAQVGLRAHELPVGCVISHQGRVIAATHNRRFASSSKIAHAEMLAIQEVDSFLYSHRGECDIFTTLEPCMMCMGAIVASRFRRLVFGARDYMAGASCMLGASEHYRFYAPTVRANCLADESLELLTEYVRSSGATWTGKYFGQNELPRTSGEA